MEIFLDIVKIVLILVFIFGLATLFTMFMGRLVLPFVPEEHKRSVNKAQGPAWFAIGLVGLFLLYRIAAPAIFGVSPVEGGAEGETVLNGIGPNILLILRVLAWIAGIIMVAGIISWIVKMIALAVAPRLSKPVIRTSPLTAWFGIIVITLYVIAAVFADVIAPFPETDVLGAEYEPPGGDYLLGTDNLGRDLFSRLIYGARNTVGIAFLTTCLAFLLGGFMGLLAATLRGWVDQVFSRVIDVMMSIPQLIFALLLLTIFGTELWTMVAVIAVLDSTRVYRLARAVAMNIVVMDYVEAAKLRGEGLWWQIRKEVLPNATAPLIAEFGLRFCFVFLLISALSFLGLGIQPPLADWGSMVRDNATLINFAQYDLTFGLTPLYPAAAIALLTVAVNFVVDWMLHRSSGLKE